jgi:molybdenum cofactor cytidylyltransferase
MSVAAIVLAAGQSTRMGAQNKLLLADGGDPLVRHAVKMAVLSQLKPVVVVLGHEADQVRAACDGLPVTFTLNPDFAQGLSSSLKTGIKALPDNIDGAAIILADMPELDIALLDRLYAAFEAEPAALAAVPVHNGQWGNPCIVAAALFPEIGLLSGDQGARKIFEKHRDMVIEMPESSDATTRDIDTPDDWVRFLRA